MSAFPCGPGLVLFSLLLVSCEPSKPGAAPIPRVKCFVVGQEATGHSRRLSGRIVAGDTSPLAFGISGTVATVNVTQGSSVSQGEVLASLDKEPIRLAVEAARAQLNAVRAKLLESKQAYDRTKTMFEKRAASKIDLEKATSQHASARENLRVAQNDLERKEIDFERTELTAPFSGTIAERSVDPFQEISALSKLRERGA